jgi:TolA-binding protein
MVDADVYGGDPGGFHRTNVLLHTINVVLLFLVLRQLTDDGPKSAFVAAVFAVHPLNVETVSWVSERKGLLSTSFGLMSLWAYACYAPRRRLAWLLLALVAYVLSLMSKQMLVTLPCLLLLLDFWPLHRAHPNKQAPTVSPDPPGKSGDVPLLEQTADWRRLVWEKTPFAVIAAVFCLIALEAQRRGSAIETLEQLPVSWRLSNAIVAYRLYVQRVFWPVGLAVHYPHPGNSLPVVSVVLSGCLLCLLTGVVFRQRRQRPYLLVGWLWFLVALLPVIGIVQIGIQQMADRYAYLPTVGLFLAVTWCVPSLAPASPWRRGLLRLGSGLVLAGLSLFSWIQASYWLDSFTLFERALAVTKNNAVAHTNLGEALLDEGLREEAIEQFRAAITADPNFSLAHNNLGVALLGQGQLDKATESFLESLRIHPSLAEAQVNLGIARCLTGDRSEGVQLFRSVLREHPDHIRAHVCLAWVLSKLGKVEEAQKHAEFVRAYEGETSPLPTPTDALPP